MKYETCLQTRIKRNILNLIKDVYKTPTIYFILNEQVLKLFPRYCQKNLE